MIVRQAYGSCADAFWCARWHGGSLQSEYQHCLSDYAGMSQRGS
jgi:hypothetical protein